MPSSKQKSDPTKYVGLISFLWLGNTFNYILWFFNPILSARSSLHTSSCFKCEKKSLFFFTIMYPMTVVELICSGYRSSVFSEVHCLSSLCWGTIRWSYLSLRCRCQFYFPCIAVCKLLIYDLLSLLTPSFYKKVVDFKTLYVGRVSFGSCFLWTIRVKLDFYQHQL